jgi:hypothetical protein
VIIFTTRDRSDKRDDAVAVDEVELSERNRQGLAWLDEYMSTPQTAEDRRWGKDFRRFLAEHRLDLTRQRV